MKAKPNDSVLDDICSVLNARNIDYRKSITWTTDAFYRETRKIVSLRKEQGASCVEMEAAALFAVAEFRGIALAQILYGGDDLSGEEWDARGWNKNYDQRRNILNLAIEACLT
jgi:purine-nucleoside phosphorylase